MIRLNCLKKALRVPFCLPSLAKTGRKRRLLTEVGRLRVTVWCISLFLVFLATTQLATAQAKKTGKPAEKPPVAMVVSPPEKGGLVQKVFEIKHAEVDRLAQVLNIFGGSISPNLELRVIGVRVQPEFLPAIEETIRRLDVPPPVPKNVELTVYLLIASPDEDTGSFPVELDGVVKQLRTTFAFKSFRTLDTLVVRSRDKRNGLVRGHARLNPDHPNPSTYNFVFKSATILSDDRGRSIRIDGLSFDASIQVKQKASTDSALVNYQTAGAGFYTEIDIREGQKVVVGKTSVGDTNTALILVVTGKVLD